MKFLRPARFPRSPTVVILLFVRLSRPTLQLLLSVTLQEGTLAGPKVLEHLVDVVINFEGDRYGGFKTIVPSKIALARLTKLQFLKMDEKGLNEVKIRVLPYWLSAKTRMDLLF